MSRPLNFLHITTFYPPYSFGGDAMYIYRLAHALGDEGHHVEVIHCRDAYHLLHRAEPEIPFSDHPNVRVHPLQSGFGPLSPLLTQQSGRPLLKRGAIERVLASRPFDVIHFHNISLFGPTVLEITPENSDPVKLYTTHEHWLVCPTHVLWKFGERACERPECLRCTLMARRPPQLWRYTGLLDRAATHVDRFVSPSRFTARMHAERGFSQPVAHLPYFIERVDEEWQEPGPRIHERPYFLFVGRLERIKGLQTLIPIWDRVEEYDLLVAGGGNEAEALRAQAAHNPRIRFLGPLSQKELGALYYHAVAVIVPSITYETFGMIIIEAFARKTPVIVRDLGALPEVVDESDGGYIYRDDAELLTAIDELGRDAGRRAELGERGYRTFIQSWTREAHLARYFDYLDEAAERRLGHIPWRVGDRQPMAEEESS